MTAYVIADVEVIDAAGYEEYRRQVPATIAAHGGRYLARGGATEKLEGSWLPKRCVILEFPDMATFKRWWDSPKYQAPRDSGAHDEVTSGGHRGRLTSWVWALDFARHEDAVRVKHVIREGLARRETKRRI